MSKNPIPYNIPAVVDRVCERVSSGETLIKICKEKGMPVLATWFRWINADATLREKYEQARIDQADVFAELIIQGPRDANTGEIAKARLEFDSLKWATSRINRKKYGDRVDHSHDHNHSLTVEQADRRLREMFKIPQSEAASEKIVEMAELVEHDPESDDDEVRH